LQDHDVFVSHASEDKDVIARPLAEALGRLGQKVWFDEFSLSVGDSLSRSIDKGLARSRYGVVVISPSFLAKRWPEYELRGLVAREMQGFKVILPVWYNVSPQDVLEFSPPLADKLAIDGTATPALSVALKILKVVDPARFKQLAREVARNEWLQKQPVTMARLEDLRLGPRRWSELPEPLLRRIRLVQQALLEVMPIDWETTVDNFCRDADPADEVQVWERVAATYVSINNNYRLSMEQRKSLLSHLLGMTLARANTEVPDGKRLEPWIAAAEEEMRPLSTPRAAPRED
jgi:hypothetical protein